MPITRDEATALAELLHEIRPDWEIRATLVQGLGPLKNHPAPLEVLAWAAIRAAKTPANTPAAIPINGRHWSLEDRPHGWEGTCPTCTPDAEDADPATGRAAAIEKAKRRAKEARETGHDEPTPEPPADTRPCPSCHRSLTTDVADTHCNQADAHPAPGALPHHYGHPDHTATHNALRPDRAGQHPDTQRRLAQQEAGAMLTARTTGEICDTDGCYWPTERHNHPIKETAR